VRLVAADRLDERGRSDLRAIYEQGFDDRLRSPFDDLWQDQVLALADESPHGMAVVRELGPTGWVFLRYFVVAAQRRGDGVGARLWGLVKTAMAGAGHTRIVFDVEDPAETPDPAEISVRRRRIGFYTRLGAQLLDVREYMPPHGDDTHPMLLMAADLDRPQTPPITGPALREIVLAVYQYRYGLAEQDGTVRNTLRHSRL
jgi:GNAT superfamily N-acetyltransferase